MYTPSSFKVDDSQVITDFLRQYSFATLVTIDSHVPHATHVPMLLRGQARPGSVIAFHLARANCQWRHMDKCETLAIFTGPHAYVSPSMYATQPNVPTWNYTAVHVYGQARLVEDQGEFSELLSELVEFYEADRNPRWNYDLPPDYRDQLMKAIVGVQLTISRIEAKFKLSQNKPEEIANVRQALQSSPNPQDQAVSKLM